MLLNCCSEGKTWVAREKPLGAEKRTNNKLEPHMSLSPKPGSHWWGASAFTTAPSLLPHVSTAPSLFRRSANPGSIRQRNSPILRSSKYYSYVLSHLKFRQERSWSALWGIPSSYLIYDVAIPFLGREITALWNEYFVKSCEGGCCQCLSVVDLWSMQVGGYRGLIMNDPSLVMAWYWDFR